MPPCWNLCDVYSELAIEAAGLPVPLAHLRPVQDRLRQMHLSAWVSGYLIE